MEKIAEKENVSIPTVRKYLARDDFSPRQPVKQQQPSILDPFKERIDAILEQDRHVWHKQRHTAHKMLARLRELGFQGSYSTVQRYMKDRKAGLQENAGEGFLDLEWDAGFAQADFGDSDFDENGGRNRKTFFCLDYPQSNRGIPQVFGEECAECLCQGLKDSFEYVGSVPHTIVFDNSSAIGQRMAGVMRESKLFLSFRLHYRFEARFCNPDSGHEKGGVENKVNWLRHNLFVPVPRIDDWVLYNRSLLKTAECQDALVHYKKEQPVGKLFEKDRAAGLPLPEKPFDVVRYEYCKTDKYGYATVGKHTYSVLPRAGLQRVVVAFRAHTVVISDEAGNELAVHRRAFGSKKTETIDHTASLTTLIQKPRGWEQSRFRHAISDVLRSYLDVQPRDMLVAYLRSLDAFHRSRRLASAIEAMELLVQRGHPFTPSDLSVMTARLDGFGLGRQPDEGPSMSYYDEVLLGVSK